MKLNYFCARQHMLEQFGLPLYETETYSCWSPSASDPSIEIRLLRSGLFAFAVNKNVGHYFRANFKKLNAQALADIAWSVGFSWALANSLASQFGEVVGMSIEIT
jgi:hypothetical protein